MTEALVDPRTAAVMHILCLLGLLILFTAHAACALRPKARASAAYFAANAVAAMLVVPAVWSLAPGIAAAVPMTWAALSLVAVALRLMPRRPPRLTPAQIPWTALARDGRAVPETAQSRAGYTA
ncbi:hypothetical protein [Sagittula stellata]|uniref:Uncharacterized protein n=1 Tax=Sagittula stellata (strain ATCC 700073 / DSM 11524 / E-37) TaxID=388399 RepID=A3K708_SAGS3|nr:hypothetical protein [Sagittula stellata]EBA07135.1 hypothetical protein SSE37_13096 [Sagittula stellata E-37]